MGKGHLNIVDLYSYIIAAPRVGTSFEFAATALDLQSYDEMTKQYAVYSAYVELFTNGIAVNTNSKFRGVLIQESSTYNKHVYLYKHKKHVGYEVQLQIGLKAFED